MDDITLIGIDGGASKVLVHKVDILTNPMRFVALKPFIEVTYESSKHFKGNFKPINFSRQLKEHHSGKKIDQTKTESQHEEAILDSFLKAIHTILNGENGNDVIIGVGLPGLKTKDQRGISAMANGPRMPDFLKNLESILKKAGYSNLNKIEVIGSDADYCGLGERWGDNGGMRGVDSAYYLGSGTGIADAMLLNKNIVPFDKCKSWIGKTWEMLATEEETFENLLSAKGIQTRYATLTGTTQEELQSNEVYPWQIYERALDGDKSALQVVEGTAEALADLLYHRIVTLAVGAPETQFIEKDRKLAVDHEYLGQIFERIVIGQRLGDIWEFKNFDSLLNDPVNEKLGRLVHSSQLPNEIKAEYLTKTNRLRDDLIVNSELRHAPALGAAVDAYLEWIEQ